MISLVATEKPSGRLLSAAGDGLAAAEFACHAGQTDLAIGKRDLAVLQFPDLIDQQRRRRIEMRRRAACRIHLVDDLDAPEGRARRFEQLVLAGR